MSKLNFSLAQTVNERADEKRVYVPILTLQAVARYLDEARRVANINPEEVKAKLDEIETVLYSAVQVKPAPGQCVVQGNEVVG